MREAGRNEDLRILLDYFCGCDDGAGTGLGDGGGDDGGMGVRQEEFVGSEEHASWFFGMSAIIHTTLLGNIGETNRRGRWQ